MLDKIQKHLLIHHPLLWNIRVVPAMIATILFHVIFFIFGYMDGTVLFTDDWHYDYENNGIAIFFSILITVLFFVVWIAFYARNNAFKSFYKISDFSLYKEWLIILLVCILNISYCFTYLTAQKVRLRTYYSYEEVQKRCETISMASIFMEGGRYAVSNGPDTTTVEINDKKYDRWSLINNNTEPFGINSGKNIDAKIKNWMQHDNRAEIRKMMQDYINIVKEHGLQTNLTADKWFDLTYNYPDFTKYEVVGRTAGQRYNNGYTDSGTSYTYSLPQNILTRSYREIGNSWADPLVDDFTIQFILYFGLSIAMLLFGFKVSSGRNLLIAVISCGLLWIVAGVFAITSTEVMVLPYFWLIAIACMQLYFFSTIAKNEGKKISGIVLNLALWSLVAILPIIYGLLMEHYHDTNNSTGYYKNGVYIYRNTPQYEWLEENLRAFTFVNVLIVIVLMFFMTKYIKKWKGIAES